MVFVPLWEPFAMEMKVAGRPRAAPLEKKIGRHVRCLFNLHGTSHEHAQALPRVK